MTPEQLKRIAELLTELRWLQACYTSFIAQDSKEYRLFKKKIDEIAVLRSCCEQVSMEAAVAKSVL